MIFDTHCHLNHEDLYPEIDRIISDAEKARVKKFLVVGYDKKTSLLAVKIAQKYDNCYAAIGFHPTEIFDLSEDDYDEVMSHLKDPKVVAIGEIGLDYHWIKDPVQREIQKEYFIRQIELANHVGLPISIHNRDSIEDCLEILKQYPPKFGGFMHCYSGSVESMWEFIKLGLTISLGGPVTFTNAKTPKQVAYEVPLDKLVVETDSPYLTPHPFRGNRNEPKNISYVVQEIARIKELSPKHIEDATYQNALKVLRIDE